MYRYSPKNRFAQKVVLCRNRNLGRVFIQTRLAKVRTVRRPGGVIVWRDVFYLCSNCIAWSNRKKKNEADIQWADELRYYQVPVLVRILILRYLLILKAIINRRIRKNDFEQTNLLNFSFNKTKILKIHCFSL